MAQMVKSVRDVVSQREIAYERSMTGADARVARHPETVAWLGKVYGELCNRSRTWPGLDQRLLKKFLRAAGVDLDATTKAHQDAVPPPADLGNDVAACLEKLTGASFLTHPPGTVCMMLHDRAQRSPHRRA
jgi:hypothetical protein